MNLEFIKEILEDEELKPYLENAFSITFDEFECSIHGHFNYSLHLKAMGVLKVDGNGFLSGVLKEKEFKGPNTTKNIPVKIIFS